MRRVSISQSSDYDVVGELIDEDTAVPAKPPPRGQERVRLRVLQSDGRAGN
jgi:hypothetical protein